MTREAVRRSANALHPLIAIEEIIGPRLLSVYRHFYYYFHNCNLVIRYIRNNAITCIITFISLFKCADQTRTSSCLSQSTRSFPNNHDNQRHIYSLGLSKSNDENSRLLLVSQLVNMVSLANQYFFSKLDNVLLWSSQRLRGFSFCGFFHYFSQIWTSNQCLHSCIALLIPHNEMFI